MDKLWELEEEMDGGGQEGEELSTATLEDGLRKTEVFYNDISQ